MIRQITRSAQLESLPLLREFIESACKTSFEIGDETIYDLKLAVDEACTNVIQYSYAGMDPGSIILSIRLGPGQVILEITDFGHPFEPCEPDRPDLEAGLSSGEISGFGLFFIYETMDEVDYCTSEDGNTLTLVKYLPIKS